MHWSELLRYATAVVALLSLTFWTGSAAKRWDHFESKERAISFSVGLILGVICYGLIEAAQQNAALGLRVALMLVALISLVLSLTWPPTSLFRRR